MAKLNSSFPCHLTVMSWKIDFVIKRNEKVKFMLNWIYFSVFIDFPQGPNPRVRSECSLKKIRTCSVSCCSSSHCMRNSQINSRRGIDQIQVIQILLGGGLFPIKITCFDSCRMTYFLSLSLPGRDGRSSEPRPSRVRQSNNSWKFLGTFGPDSTFPKSPGRSIRFLGP